MHPLQMGDHRHRLLSTHIALADKEALFLLHRPQTSDLRNEELLMLGVDVLLVLVSAVVFPVRRLRSSLHGVLLLALLLALLAIVPIVVALVRDLVRRLGILNLAGAFVTLTAAVLLLRGYVLQIAFLLFLLLFLLGIVGLCFLFLGAWRLRRLLLAAVPIVFGALAVRLLVLIALSILVVLALVSALGLGLLRGRLLRGRLCR
mmetsp:Transcript_116882/g.337765  ORF Transcript_116882/g.337765 Transcript_116882/m.337765 type:complete len:204 (+) Transcript_116882:459-1070(+)